LNQKARVPIAAWRRGGESAILEDAMNRTAISGRKPPDIGKGVIVFVLTLTAMLFLPRHAHAQDASKVLKAMSDYLTGQKTISMTFDSDIEVITSELQKAQFTSSGQVLLNRPDKLRATRTGGYADVELVFDGKTATVLGKHLNAFGQADAPGSVDQLIDHLRDRYKVARLTAVAGLRGIDSGRDRFQTHRPGRDRWHRVRAFGVSHCGRRLAALG
jgi:Predicted periplasmic protein (DUF2092)